MTSPTFDSPAHVVLNVVGIVVWVVAIVIAHRQRRSHGYSWAVAGAVLLNVSYRGVYVPIGPVIFLLARGTWDRQPRVTPA